MESVVDERRDRWSARRASKQEAGKLREVETEIDEVKCSREGSIINGPAFLPADIIVVCFILGLGCYGKQHPHSPKGSSEGRREGATILLTRVKPKGR